MPLCIYTFRILTPIKEGKLGSREEKQHRSDVQLSERLTSLSFIGTELRVPQKPPKPSQNYRMKGLREAFNWAPILPRLVFLCDSGCTFIQSRLGFVILRSKYAIVNITLRAPTLIRTADRHLKLSNIFY